MRLYCKPLFSKAIAVTAAGLSFAVTPVQNLADPAPSPAARLQFARDARPILTASCVQCHGEKKKKGNIDFAAIVDEPSAVKQKKLWRKAIEQVESGEMPPDDAEPLKPEQKRALLAWMKQAVTVDPNDLSQLDPGPSIVRRLNRAEYTNTIRDLLGVDFDAGAQAGIPDDQPVEGFSTLATTLTIPATLMEKYFAAADQVLAKLLPEDGSPEAKAIQGLDPKRKPPQQLAKIVTAREQLLIAKPGPQLSPRDAAKQVIERLATRAYRRPVKPPEVGRLLTLFDKSAQAGGSFESGVRLMAKVVLVSPHFLLRVEQDRPAVANQPGNRINDFELATRLSYFLWSSMPDEELVSAAREGKLSDPAALERQVRRMLVSPKSKALTEQFAAQWLQLRKVAEARPSTEFFPTFTPKVRQAMFDETFTFFDKLREEDRSILDLLHADYTYVNEDLAKHYGLPPVKGPEIRRVDLKPADHRGGLLGMGSVLALTSHTSRTSPTLRGKYVLEVIFGTPPPPPPANVSQIDEKKNGKEARSFRELLDQHAANATCAACHKKIDPLGFGLENFDAVGRWREEAGGKPVDNTGKLVTGESFRGADELKKILVGRKDQFVRNASEQMLSYALGRQTEDCDESTLDGVKTSLEKNGYKFSTLVLEIVRSYPFQHRRPG